MKNKTIKLVCFVRLGGLFIMASLLLACSSGGITSRPDQLGLASTNFTPKIPQAWSLANGLKVFYSYNPEVPLISGTLYIPGGSLYEPEKLVGVASACGDLMREGGVRGISPGKLDSLLDGLGASIETGFSDEFGSFSFSSLSEDFEQVFAIFSDVLQKPSFGQKRFALWKQLAANQIIRRKDSPETMAAMIFAEQIYGEGSPYARKISPESLERINIGSIRKYFKRFVGPKGAILAVSGSVPKEKFASLLEQHFAAWQPQSASLPDYPPVRDKINPGIYVLERNFDQAAVLVGHLGPKRHSKDRFPLHIFNRLFGYGSFDSELFNYIRSKLGLAYVVYGGFSPGPASGEFQIYAGTRVSQAIKAVKEILDLVERQKEKAYSDERINSAIASASKNFVFKFSSPGALVTRQAMLEMLNFPENYNETFVQNIQKVSSQQVLEVAQQRLMSEQVIVIVGNISAEQVKKELGQLGPVYRLDFDYKPKVLGQI